MDERVADGRPTEVSQVSAREWRTLAAVLTAAFMSLIDVTIVNVALPSVQRGLGAASSTLEWVVAGYALAFGLTLIPGGRLGDRIGHRTTFVVGLAVFTAASAACGLARSPNELVAARLVQGCGAGLFNPATSAIIQRTFTGPARSRAFSIYGATVGLSIALGPVLGGVILAVAGPLHGWRWVFLVNVPIGVVLLPVALRVLRGTDDARRPRGSDHVGLALLTTGLLLLLVPLVEGQSRGWPSWTFVSMALALPVLVLLGVREVRLERAGGEPLVPPHLVRSWSFSAGAVVALVYFAGFTSIFFTTSILWQEGLGRSALAAGAVVVPFAVASMVSSASSDSVSRRLGRRILTLACTLVTLGLLGALLVVHLQAPEPSAWALVVPLAVTGVGNGLFIAPNQDFVLKTVRPSEAGTAGGVLNTAQRLGSAVGIAVVGTVLFGSLHVDPAGGVLATARAYTHSAELALSVNVAFMALALVLVTAVRSASGGAATTREPAPALDAGPRPTERRPAT